MADRLRIMILTRISFQTEIDSHSAAADTQIARWHALTSAIVCLLGVYDNRYFHPLPVRNSIKISADGSDLAKLSVVFSLILDREEGRGRQGEGLVASSTHLLYSLYGQQQHEVPTLKL